MPFGSLEIQKNLKDSEINSLLASYRLDDSKTAFCNYNKRWATGQNLKLKRLPRKVASQEDREQKLECFKHFGMHLNCLAYNFFFIFKKH